ncbi:P-loop containing nucleoside triphosphate hydrolase protein [Mycena crocata]|nr:P-loop containing nucleoside triphosphate hydrolase protein [Mycena crocata]
MHCPPSDVAVVTLLPEAHPILRTPSSVVHPHRPLLAEMEPEIFRYHLVLLGDTGVGKTSLAELFTLDIYGEVIMDEPRYSPTFHRQLVVDNQTYILELIEVPSQQAHTPGGKVEEWMQKGQGIALIYSIASRTSFAHTETLADTVLKVTKRVGGVHGPPMILLGNKQDIGAFAREVSEEEGTLLARRIGCPFLEVSGKTGQDVYRAFTTLVREIRAREVAAGDDSAIEKEQQKQKDGKWKKRLGRGKCVVL